MKYLFKSHLSSALIVIMLIISSYTSLKSQSDSLYISEFVAANKSSLADEDGDFSDWIEIYNPTTTDIDLQGWYLTDNAAKLDKWAFPKITLLSNSYIVIFASNKDRTVITGKLHTNFKLSASGEYLALVKPDKKTIVSSFTPAYPEQGEDVAYGILNNEIVYLTTPTPGKANAGESILPPPTFNVPHGFFSTSFYVTISTVLTGANIYYTTDGSEPSINSALYSSPIIIATTTPLRALVVKDSLLSKSVTASYIFLNDVLNQPNNPTGYPSTWGTYWDFRGTATADYEMDPEIVYHADYKDLMIPALTSVPTISIVTDKGNLFSHDSSAKTGGIYVFTAPYDSYGKGWERAASCEYFSDKSDEGFQVNCGITLQGGASRQAEKTPKHSFRLIFDKQYGVSELNFPIFGKDATDIFNSIVLRASYGNSWRHFDASQRKRATHIQDIWAKDTQLDMGYPSAHSKFAHLYLNGIYWGLYNLSERVDKDFMNSYYKGDKNDFDILKDYSEVVDGDTAAWNYVWSIVSKDTIKNNKAYQQFIGKNEDGSANPAYSSYIDPINLCDYMLLNFYGGNNDWDHHNWVAGRNKTNPGKGFQFYCWDTEKILENISENYVNENNATHPSGIFRGMLKNCEFKLLFADRVNLLLKNKGMLTPDKVVDRWKKRADEIELAIIGESARWGDYRRDVHPWSGGPYLLYTRNEHWNVEKERLLNEYFPTRSDVVYKQIKAAGLLPLLDAPEFLVNGNNTPISCLLTLKADSGEVYYTTDGTDPRLIGGSISSNASHFNAPLTISETTIIHARAKDGDVWSAIAVDTFTNTSKTNIASSFAYIQSVKAYPNPFCTYTIVSYNLPVSGSVNMKVFSVEGKQVDAGYIGYQNDGPNRISWKPRFDLEKGVYFIELSSGEYKIKSKVIYNP
jgi:hypothetical protein